LSGLPGIMEAEDVEIIFDLEKNLFNKIFWRALKRFSNRFLCVCCPSLVKIVRPQLKRPRNDGFMMQIWYSCVWMMDG
jgi:hypothetical protein